MNARSQLNESDFDREGLPPCRNRIRANPRLPSDSRSAIAWKNSMHTQLSVALFTYIPSLALTLAFKSLSHGHEHRHTNTTHTITTLLYDLQTQHSLEQHFCHKPNRQFQIYIHQLLINSTLTSVHHTTHTLKLKSSVEEECHSSLAVCILRLNYVFFIFFVCIPCLHYR